MKIDIDIPDWITEFSIRKTPFEIEIRLEKHIYKPQYNDPIRVKSSMVVKCSDILFIDQAIRYAINKFENYNPDSNYEKQTPPRNNK